MNVKQFFHYVSYLQYPLAIIGLLMAFKPYVVGFERYRENPGSLINDLNMVLILMGLAISFSTLQDTRKTQNKISLKIWQSPTKGKIFLAILSLLALGLIITGVTAYFAGGDSNFKDLAIGIIVMGIGLIGLLKTAIEMFEHHRLDKTE